MKNHQIWSEQLPEYVNGSMSSGAKKVFEEHLASCETCQEELELWQNVAGTLQVENAVPALNQDLSERALAEVQYRSRQHWNLPYVFSLIRSQIPLIHAELWASAFLILMIGVITAHLFDQPNVFTFLMPLVTAGCVATIYGKENDLAYELLLSTPVAQTQILLSRLVLVFGYNLILFLISILFLRPLQQDPITLNLISQWLAPMTFLSSLALLLSVSVGSSQAVLVTYVLWLSTQFLQADVWVSQVFHFLMPMVGFWNQTLPLYMISAVMLLITILFLRFPLNAVKNSTM